MVKIKLSHGGVAYVDEADVSLVSQYRWHQYKGYAEAPHRGTTVRMHRLILGVVGRKQLVDHMNGNKLDNRRSNLRPASASQNRMNCRRLATNKSGYKGVSWRKNTSDKCWVAFIYKNYRQHYLGYFTSPVDAAKAYDDAARVLHGEFARLNFAGGV